MTVPMDCTISYTAGTLFAVSSADALRSDPQRAARSLRRGRIFSAMVTLPIGIYFLFRWPDWSWMYLAREHSRSKVLGAAGLGGYLLSHEIGYRQAARLVRAHHAGRALALSAISLAFFFMIVIAGWKRFRWQGDTRQFETGTARDALLAADFVFPFVLSIAFFSVGVLVVVFLNLRDR